MDDPPTNEEPKKDFNPLDLSQLQSFSFGTQWTQDKGEAGGRSSRTRDDRPHRDGPPGAENRRDRRGFRRPQGAPGGAGGPGAERRGGDSRPDRREPHFRDRGTEGPGGRTGGYRGPRSEGGPGGYGHGSYDRGPYISPHFDVTFYPEDTSFTALAKTIRASCRTFELFDIARTVIGKNDRFVVVVQRKTREAGAAPPAKQPLYISVPDGVPYETEDAAIDHVMKHHLDRFFESAEVEVEAPKGNYQVINRCGVTGELLGPPNYHRYAQIVQQHHAARLPHMPFDAFRARIESVRDPEVVSQWLDKMKKVTRYTSKLDQPSPAAAPAESPPAPAKDEAPVESAASSDAVPDESGASGEATTAAETSATEAAEETVAEAAAPAENRIAFDSPSEARIHLLLQARDKVVRAVEYGRFHGRMVEQIPDSEIKRAVEGALERQRRFPLDTANALRGRLRREGFTIFKKGSKGISYVCAVKRKFRVPGQTFADSIGELIAFIEAHPMVRASELPQKFLGLGAGPKTDQPLSPEDQQRLARMQGDLRWLVAEGYVTEFIDGGLFAPPPMVEARTRDSESTESDLENYPEAPSSRAAPAAPPAEKVQPATPEQPPPEQASPAPEAVRPVVDETPVQPEMPDSPAPAEEAEENAPVAETDGESEKPAP